MDSKQKVTKRKQTGRAPRGHLLCLDERARRISGWWVFESKTAAITEEKTTHRPWLENSTCGSWMTFESMRIEVGGTKNNQNNVHDEEDSVQKPTCVDGHAQVDSCIVDIYAIKKRSQKRKANPCCDGEACGVGVRAA
jgi:hypothetical protein